jgi:hypothetical protein
MPAETRTFLIFGLAALLIGFRLYRSVRRNIGRQAFLKRLLIVRILLLLAVTGLVFGFSPGVNSAGIAAAAAGAIIGAGIAAYALMHTRIERTERGIFYTGHPYIGLGILGVFVARLVFNLATVFPRMQQAAAAARAHPGARQAMMQPANSPLTLAIFALMVGYYVVYSAGLLRLAREQ